MPRRRTIALVALATLVAAGGACGNDGRTLAPAPPTTATTTDVADVPTAQPMRLSSVDIAADGAIDPRFTCDGGGEAPSLVITGAPAEAAELAVAVVDLDADGYVHWLVAGLPADVGALEPSALPATAVQARSSSGAIGWSPPCPPPGDGPHRYEVRAYALASSSGVTPGAEGRDALELLEQAAIERATFTATYERP